MFLIPWSNWASLGTSCLLRIIGPKLNINVWYFVCLPRSPWANFSISGCSALPQDPMGRLKKESIGAWCLLRIPGMNQASLGAWCLNSESVYARLQASDGFLCLNSSICGPPGAELSIKWVLGVCPRSLWHTKHQWCYGGVLRTSLGRTVSINRMHWYLLRILGLNEESVAAWCLVGISGLPVLEQKKTVCAWCVLKDPWAKFRISGFLAIVKDPGPN